MHFTQPEGRQGRPGASRKKTAAAKEEGAEATARAADKERRNAHLHAALTEAWRRPASSRGAAGGSRKCPSPVRGPGVRRTGGTSG